MAAAAVAAVSNPVGQTQIDFYPLNWEAIKNSPLGILIRKSDELAQKYFETNEINEALLATCQEEARTILISGKENPEEVKSVAEGLEILRFCVQHQTHDSRIQAIINWLIHGNQEVKESELGKGSFGKVVKIKFGCIEAAVKILKEVKTGEAEVEAHLKAQGEREITLLFGYETIGRRKASADRYRIGLELALNTLEQALEKPEDPKEDEFVDSEEEEKPKPITIRHLDTEEKQLIFETLIAIKHLHEEKKIVHGDIKANNIFIMSGSNGEIVKLGDFGTAVQEGAKSDQYGNIFYAALEIVYAECNPLKLDEPTITLPRTRSSDMWSFGIALFRILTNEYPLGKTFENRDYVMKNNLRELAVYLYKKEPANESILNYIKEKNLSILDLCPQGDAPSEALNRLFIELKLEDAQKQQLIALISNVSFNQEAIQELFRKNPIGYDLINHLLKIDPTTRLSAQNALLHRWFMAPL